MRRPSSFLEVDHGLGKKQTQFRLMRWLAVLTPALVVGLLEFLRHQWLETLLPTWWSEGWFGNLVGAATVAVLVYVFVRFFTDVLQRSASEVTQAREEAAVIVERQRIAREMHDAIAQTLFYLMVKLREVDDLMMTDESKQAYDELQTMREETKAAYRQVKTVIADLRQQAELEDLGEAMRRTAIGLVEHLGMQVKCEVVGRINLPASSRDHVLAIVQEALINASRHGHARQATVYLKKIGKDIVVEVSDNGGGFDPSAVPREGRYGLAIMEERAQLSGGRLSLDSAPGRGTCITVRLPGAIS